MRCIGRTKSLNRCKNQTTGKFKLFCHLHWWQPIILFLISIPAVLGSYAGIYRDIIEPFLPKTEKKEILDTNLIKPIRTESRDLKVSEYLPNEKICFSIIFHFKNFSDYTFQDYKTTHYELSIGNGKNRPIIQKSQTLKSSELKIFPQNEFSLNSSITTWYAPKKDLDFDDFIGVIKHEYADLKGKTIIDYEFYWLILNEHQNQLSTGIPPDYIIEEFRPILDSLKITPTNTL